jgi:hypothetical protein
MKTTVRLPQHILNAWLILLFLAMSAAELSAQRTSQSLSGPQVVSDSKAKVDEVVADTTFAIPLTEVDALENFKNFRYPFLQDDGTVIFIGNDLFKSNRAERHNGIFRSHPDGTLETLVLQEHPSPDDGLPVGPIMGLRTDFDSIIFHRGLDHGSGLYGFFGRDPLETIANCSTLVPGSEEEKFKWFWYADVYKRWVVFNATVREHGAVWQHGLYLYHQPSRQLWSLIDSSQVVPALGTPVGMMAYQPSMDASWLVFSANQLASPNGKSLPGRGILGWPMKRCLATGQPPALTELQVLAPFGFTIPQSGGRKLTSAPNPHTADGIIAVIGGHDPSGSIHNEQPAYQALLVRTRDGEWLNPIDTDTLIPGHPDGTSFTGFNKWVAVQSEKVTFIANGPQGYQAIYIYDVREKTLYFIIDTQRQIAGQPPLKFEHSSRPLVNQRLALMARFSNGFSGEYLATLPGLRVLEMKRKTEQK